MNATVRRTSCAFPAGFLLFLLLWVVGCSTDSHSVTIDDVCVRSAADDGQKELVISTTGNTPLIVRNVDCGAGAINIDDHTEVIITSIDETDPQQLSDVLVVYEPPQEIIARIPSNFAFTDGDRYRVIVALPLGYSIDKDIVYPPRECSETVTDTGSPTETDDDETGNDSTTETITESIDDTEDTATNQTDTLTDDDTTTIPFTDSESDDSESDDSESDSETGSASDTDSDSSSDIDTDTQSTDSSTNTGTNTETETDTDADTGTHTEADTDTDADTETVDILSIIAVKEYDHDAEYTSGRLNSRFQVPNDAGTFVEARLKLVLGKCSEDNPYLDGSWAAFWMLGSNSDEQGYGGTVTFPECGHIVMVQWISSFGDAYYNTTQSGGSAFEADTAPSNVDFTSGPEQWHTYGVRFNDDTITFTFDGEDVSTKIYDDADAHTHRILLNMAVGGDDGGIVDENFTQDMLQVDWVRVTDADGELLWADEMNDKAYTRQNWFPFVGMAYNNELQYYTLWEPDNFQWHSDFTLGECE